MSDMYPSRVESTQAKILPRLDPVVYAKESSVLPDMLSWVDVKSYKERGFLLKDFIFSESEIERLIEEVKQEQSLKGNKGDDYIITEPRSGAVRSKFSVHLHNHLLNSLARDSRLVSIVKFLLGSEVYLHQSRINYKPAFGGKDFFWHSDFETWHVEDGMPRMRAISVSITLTENTLLNGPLLIVPGSHHSYISCAGLTPEKNYQSSLQEQHHGTPDTELLSKVIDAGSVYALTGKPGTVTFFDCNAMHGSNSNITPAPRTNVFLVYNSVKNKLLKPFCGLEPRPEYLAARTQTDTITEDQYDLSLC